MPASAAPSGITVYLGSLVVGRLLKPLVLNAFRLRFQQADQGARRPAYHHRRELRAQAWIRGFSQLDLGLWSRRAVVRFPPA